MPNAKSNARTLPSAAHLERQLGLWGSVALVVGITIGSGIFRTPAVIAGRVPDPILLMTVWVLAGIIALCGALSIAELAASIPQTGGIYAFLREGWGRLPAFLFGWAQLLLIRASALGALALVFGEYLLRSIGYNPGPNDPLASWVAAGALVFAAAVNIRGVRLAAVIVGASTLTKYLALAGIILAAFLLGGRHGASLSHFWEGGSAVQPGLFGLALISALWAYDGFADLSFASGEVANPQRTLPRALILGTLAIVVIYLGANAAYLYVTPVDRMAGFPLVAADTMLAIFGGPAVTLVSFVVMISTFSSLNGTMFASPRIFFAMADDGLFFKPIARVHPRFHTPWVAITLAAGLGVAFVLTRSFEQLTDTFVLTMWPFYGLTVLAIYRLRRTRPDLPRPYRVVGYPFVPLVFLAAAVYLVGNALVTDPFWTLVVFGIVLAGVPVYMAAFRRRNAGRPKA